MRRAERRVKATRFEFRYRLWIGFAIYVLGFWAPWLRYGPGATRVTTIVVGAGGRTGEHACADASSGDGSRDGAGNFSGCRGRGFRVWGTAYLGAGIVDLSAMHTQTMVAAGPYRHVRNPLYFGSLVFSLAVAILMPPTGAIFFILAIFVQMLRLILREEAYLTAQQGEPYLAYKARVPRLFPSLACPGA